MSQRNEQLGKEGQKLSVGIIYQILSVDLKEIYSVTQRSEMAVSFKRQSYARCTLVGPRGRVWIVSFRDLCLRFVTHRGEGGCVNVGNEEQTLRQHTCHTCRDCILSHH